MLLRVSVFRARTEGKIKMKDFDCERNYTNLFFMLWPLIENDAELELR
jgi:hypothetical protein